MLKQDEIDKLTDYLSTLFSSDSIAVLQHPEEDNVALVAKDQNFFARIDRDEDEGELSYNFSKEIPDQPFDELNASVKEIFNSQAVEVRRRPNKSDSAEIYKGEEFLGVLYDDDDAGDGMQIFNMAILDIDLEGDFDADDEDDA
ncbi:conserved hypothetical protein [Ahrensia sp. R2A130]|nr:conserved hypothetical protein [Ahrensia sp. R2A130]